MNGDVELELRALIAAYDRALLDRGLYNATVRDGMQKRVYELRTKLFDMEQQAAARKAFATRCCELDTDGDGNCPMHSAPGVLRKIFR